MLLPILSIRDAHAAIGVADLDSSTQEGAAAALDVIKNAINYLSDVRGTDVADPPRTTS